MQISAKFGLALASALAACSTVSAAPGSASDTVTEVVMQGERLHPESITSDSQGTLYIGSNPGIVFRAQAGEAVAHRTPGTYTP